MTTIRLVIGLLFGCLAVWAQGAPPTTPLPKCIIPFVATGASNFPSATGFDNRQMGCKNWRVTYNSFGFSAVSITVQTAPMGSTLIAGTWSTFTATSGSNPNTTTTQATSTFIAYFPWIRVHVTTTGSGRISGVLEGSDDTYDVSSGSSGCVGTIATPCVVVGPGADGAAKVGSPVRIGISDGSGNTQDVLGDTAGDIFTVIVGNGTFNASQQAVTASAVALGTNSAKGVCIKALRGNLINVYVGPSGVTTATGLELAPGDAYCTPLSNTNLMFVIASTTGASVSWALTN